MSDNAVYRAAILFGALFGAAAAGLMYFPIAAFSERFEIVLVLIAVGVGVLYGWYGAVVAFFVMRGIIARGEAKREAEEIRRENEMLGIFED